MNGVLIYWAAMKKKSLASTHKPFCAEKWWGSKYSKYFYLQIKVWLSPCCLGGGGWKWVNLHSTGLTNCMMIRAYLHSQDDPMTKDHGRNRDSWAWRWKLPSWPWCNASTATLDGLVWGILYLVPMLICKICVEFVQVGNRSCLSALGQTPITRVVIIWQP